MDYQRIYRDFIADRKGKPAPVGYSERHHILPRCLGGGDEPGNLIRLTPEDHFFAHLLLAKIHGGRLWAPVAFMVGGQRKDYRPIASRRRYSWVKVAMGQALSGPRAHQFDWTVYRLRHTDGRTWSGYQSQMPEIGIPRTNANMLVKGTIRSSHGWHFADHAAPDRSGANHPAYKHERLLFRHVDGRTFHGTSYELAQHAGLTPQKTSNVRAGRQRVASGWYRDGFPPHPTGRGAKLPGADASSKIRLKHRDGREFSGTRREAMAALGLCDGGGGTLAMVLNGKRPHTKGWSIAA